MIRSLVKRARRAFEALVDNDDSDVDRGAPAVCTICGRFTEICPHGDLDLGSDYDTAAELERIHAASERMPAEPIGRRFPLPQDTRVEDEHGNVIARGATVEDEYVDQFVTEDELTRLHRRCGEYFKIIEAIEKERNEWIEMWRTQAGEHLTAQAMLERSLAATRQTAARAIVMLNKMRKAAKLEPILKPDGLESYDGEPVGLAEDYAVRMLSLRKKLGAPIDAKAARDVVDARTESVLTGDIADAENGARTLDGEAAGASSDEQHDPSADGRADAVAQGDR